MVFICNLLIFNQSKIKEWIVGESGVNCAAYQDGELVNHGEFFRLKSMEAYLNKKGKCDFLTHNLDFFFSEFWEKKLNCEI